MSVHKTAKPGGHLNGSGIGGDMGKITLFSTRIPIPVIDRIGLTKKRPVNMTGL